MKKIIICTLYDKDGNYFGLKEISEGTKVSILFHNSVKNPANPPILPRREFESLQNLFRYFLSQQSHYVFILYGNEFELLKDRDLYLRTISSLEFDDKVDIHCITQKTIDIDCGRPENRKILKRFSFQKNTQYSLAQKLIEDNSRKN